MNKTGKIIVLEEYKSNAEKSVPEQRKQTAPGKQRVRLKKRSLLKGIGAVAGFFVLLYLLGCTPFFQVNQPNNH